LPGSRMGEVMYLGPVFMEAAAWLKTKMPELKFVVAAASPAIRATVERESRARGLQDAVIFINGRAREVMGAADAVIVASGTATLEGMLVGRPMVVAYKASRLTVWLLRVTGVVKVKRFSLPNLLAGEDLVPELIQEDATGSAVGAAALAQLQASQTVDHMLQRFKDLAGQLRCGASKQASKSISEILERD